MRVSPSRVLSIYEFNRHPALYIRMVAVGDPILITDRGKPSVMVLALGDWEGLCMAAGFRADPDGHTVKMIELNTRRSRHIRLAEAGGWFVLTRWGMPAAVLAGARLVEELAKRTGLS